MISSKRKKKFKQNIESENITKQRNGISLRTESSRLKAKKKILTDSKEMEKNFRKCPLHLGNAAKLQKLL